MHELKTLSYCELRNKEVVNVLDGKRLGRIIDIVFSGCDKAHVRGIVVPFTRRVFLLKDKEIFVPWHCIRRIGEDVILVELVVENSGHHTSRRRSKYEPYKDEIHGHHKSSSHGSAHLHSIDKEETDEEKEEK
ncbi:MAG: YlmC/YmxH family sporulation protein [Firmicutes bacterium]|nr:YlmC/YmxH family sporulation protein [Bacillota bacterium]